MVAAAAALTPSDQPAAADRTTTNDGPVAGRFLDAVDASALHEAARAMVVPEPVEPPEPVAPAAELEREPPPAPTPPRQRATRRNATGSSQFLAALVKRPASRAPGTLVVRARGGSCRFWIDGAVSGEGRVVKIPAAPGPHTVACRGADGRPRVQRVNVLPGGIAVAAFHLDG